MSQTEHGKYGCVAVSATALALQGMPPVLAWDAAASQAFPSSQSGQSKSCPRSTFLSLAAAGQIKGVSPGKYANAVENKQHAEDALLLLRSSEDQNLSQMELWAQVLGSQRKKHNGQMSVVLGLWRAKLFVGQDA